MLKFWRRALGGREEGMSVRERNLARLGSLGFRVAPSLPTVRWEGPTRLRPREEIGARLGALAAVFLWAAALAEDIPDAEIKRYMTANDLGRWLTGDEAAVLELARDEAAEFHRDTIGWRLENMWALAWVLGFEPQPGLAGMIEGETIQRMLTEFVKCPGDSVAGLLARSRPRPVEAVDELEDLFYCAHNAVRSAQLGGNTVPKKFHPLADGGGVHERRHALTWALSPGVEWDETDLST